MLTQEDLVDLYGRLRDAKVLSVYIEGGQTDPAERRAWATRVQRGLDDERARVEREEPELLQDFDGARSLVENELRQFPAFLPDRGWAGFATADELHHAEAATVPFPDLVRFERGLRAAPYVRALKQGRPVVGALADSRQARVYLYRRGELEEVVDLKADRDFGDLADSVSSTRGGRFSGARGATGTDTARNLADRAAARLHNELLDRVSELAGSDGFVVFGGTSEVEAALSRQGGSFGDRWIVRPSLHMGSTETEVKGELEAAASELTRRRQADLLQEVVDAARAGGKGCLGIEATRSALLGGQVDTLLVGRSFRERDPDLADHFVGTALQQGSSLEELSADESERLDAEGEGVGARLRYTL